MVVVGGKGTLAWYLLHCRSLGKVSNQAGCKFIDRLRHARTSAFEIQPTKEQAVQSTILMIKLG